MAGKKKIPGSTTRKETNVDNKIKLSDQNIQKNGKKKTADNNENKRT